MRSNRSNNNSNIYILPFFDLRPWLKISYNLHLRMRNYKKKNHIILLKNRKKSDRKTGPQRVSRFSGRAAWHFISCAVPPSQSIHRARRNIIIVFGVVCSQRPSGAAPTGAKTSWRPDANRRERRVLATNNAYRFSYFPLSPYHPSTRSERTRAQANSTPGHGADTTVGRILPARALRRSDRRFVFRGTFATRANPEKKYRVWPVKYQWAYHSFTLGLNEWFEHPSLPSRRIRSKGATLQRSIYSGVSRIINIFYA